MRFAAFLVSLAVVIAFWVFPNLWRDAATRKQTRTMVDLGTLRMALDAYAKDHHSVPQVASCRELAATLVPKYLRSMGGLCRDGWGREIAVNHVAGGSTYVLGSAGHDGVFSPPGKALFAKRGAPHFEPGLAEFLWSSGTWYDMDLVATPAGFVAVPWDGQESRPDYRRAPASLWRVAWIVTAVWLAALVPFAIRSWRDP
jgi:hypothetical protein